jgi:uncharacterized protein YukE
MGRACRSVKGKAGSSPVVETLVDKFQGPTVSNPDGWEGDETAERLYFDQAQELLKQDAEAYNRWLIELDRELNQTEREDA